MIALPVLLVLLAIIVGLYWLVVKGLLFRLILLIGGCFCIWVVLSTQPSMQAEAFKLGGMSFSLAAVLPLGLAICVLLTTKD